MVWSDAWTGVRKRWPAAALSGFLGVLLVVAGALAAGYAQAVLLQIGSTFLLLVPLVLAEQYFLSGVERQVVEAVAEQQSDRTEDGRPTAEAVQRAAVAAGLDVVVDTTEPNRPTFDLGGKRVAVLPDALPIASAELGALAASHVNVVVSRRGVTKAGASRYPSIASVIADPLVDESLTAAFRAIASREPEADS